jgi:hypothetical protein
VGIQYNLTLGPPAAPPMSFATALSGNGRYLVDQNGQPFLIVGSSEQTWTNISVAAAESVLATRASQGFNFELFIIISGPYESGQTSWATFDGVVPFYQSDGVTLGTGPSNYDVTKPYLPFWTRWDSLFAYAQSVGITPFVNLLSTPAYQDNPTFYAGQGTTKLATFATWFANRYPFGTGAGQFIYHHYWGDDHFSNISGGWSGVDPYITAMMNAVKAVNPGCLHSIENNDGIWDPGTELNLSSDDTNWTFGTSSSTAGQMNINFMYDSRNNSPDTSRAYLAVAIPVCFFEGLYENAPAGKNTWSNLLNREYLYFPMINGGCGSFYGCFPVEKFGSGYASDLVTTAVSHVGIWKRFMASIAWRNLVPDTGKAFVTTGNTYSAGATGTNAAVSADGHLGLVYLSANGSVTVAMSKMAGTTTAQWFDPTNATYTLISSSLANTGTHTFTSSTNNSAGDPDWVLVLTA